MLTIYMFSFACQMDNSEVTPAQRMERENAYDVV